MAKAKWLDANGKYHKVSDMSSYYIRNCIKFIDEKSQNGMRVDFFDNYDNKWDTNLKGQEVYDMYIDVYIIMHQELIKRGELYG